MYCLSSVSITLLLRTLEPDSSAIAVTASSAAINSVEDGAKMIDEHIVRVNQAVHPEESSLSDDDESKNNHIQYLLQTIWLAKQQA